MKKRALEKELAYAKRLLEYYEHCVEELDTNFVLDFCAVCGGPTLVEEAIVCTECESCCCGSKNEDTAHLHRLKQALEEIVEYYQCPTCEGGHCTRCVPRGECTDK